MGAVVGSAIALFLWSLDEATALFWQNPGLLYFLPVAGLLSGLMYHFFGGVAERGNNLVIQQIHDAGHGVPLRMGPLVLLGTLITHLCGGSAGREGTAVQIGGSFAAALGRWLRLEPEDTRIILIAGMAAGFSAVFGTPLTAVIFSIEVLAIGRMGYQAVIPCVIASVIGDQVCASWGVGHVHYFVQSIAPLATPPEAITLDWLLTGKVAVAAIAFGLVSVLFAELTHAINHVFRRTIRHPWLRPAVGGLLVIGLVWLLGTRDYLGLGVISNPAVPGSVSISTCFLVGGAGLFSWWWKLLFTAVTVGSGFKGGEVTPLFFIGAALGNVCGQLLGVPVDLMAALGFVAVFAGATNTPLACTIMAIELFAPFNGALLSSGFVVYATIACFFSYIFSGHSTIYSAQQIGVPKTLHRRVLRALKNDMPPAP